MITLPNESPEQKFQRLYRYSPENGKFFRNFSRGKFAAGSVAGWRHPKGFLVITFSHNRVQYDYKAHRIAWYILHGYWPSEVDHKNGIRSDNRAENLREPKLGENNLNRKIQEDNTTGIAGVTFCLKTRKFRARISKGDFRRHLGYFDSLEAAKTARLRAEELLYKEYRRKP